MVSATRSLVVLIAVFALGAVTGSAVTYVSVAASHLSEAPPWAPRVVTVEERAEMLAWRLSLRPDQRGRVLEVLRGHQARNLAARVELRNAVRDVLDEDQRARFDLLTGHTAEEDRR